MELPRRAAHAIRSCLCMFRRGRTFSKNTRKSGNQSTLEPFWNSIWPAIASKTLKDGTWGLWGAKSRGRERFGVQNGGERLRLGCKMEGPGGV